MSLAELSIEEAAAKYPCIRPEILAAFYRHIDHGRKVGDFVTAVLENNLKESFARADDQNRIVLFEIVSFVYNVAPSGCWGNPKQVKAWREARQKERN